MGVIKQVVVGAVATFVIGGSAYTVSQTDVARNFAQDTGMSQQQAEKYVNSIDKNSLVSFDKIGEDMTSESSSILSAANKIDCANYKYEWESATLPCETGKSQLRQFGTDENSLGESYKKLTTKTASTSDISNTITLIDKINLDFGFDIVVKSVDQSTIQNIKQSNSYNKSLLKAALESK